MKLLTPYLIVFSLVLFVFACKDKEEDNHNNNGGGSNKPKGELLTQKNWKVSSLVASGTDVWNSFMVEACSKDNEYKFRTDDSLALYDKSNKCDMNDPDSTVSSYQLYNNNTQLILYLSLSSSFVLDDTVDIVELNDNTLKLNFEYSGIPATVTFKHP